MAHLTREQILARKVGKGVVTLADGSTVEIRALTRDEVLAMQQMDDLGDRDNFLISTGMVDPKLSPEDVAQWGAAGAAGDISAISAGIAEVSGLKEGAGKRGVASPRER
jgi:hypothetical protein